MHAFLSNLANKQTDRQTNEHGQKHLLPHLSEVMTSKEKHLANTDVEIPQHALVAFKFLLMKVLENRITENSAT